MPLGTLQAVVEGPAWTRAAKYFASRGPEIDYERRLCLTVATTQPGSGQGVRTADWVWHPPRLVHHPRPSRKLRPPAPQPRHRDLCGRSRTLPPRTRITRSAAFPHPPRTPPHDGHASSPPASCRSTTDPSPFTVSTTPPRVTQRPSPVSLRQKSRGGPLPLPTRPTLSPRTTHPQQEPRNNASAQPQRRKPARTSQPSAQRRRRRSAAPAPQAARRIGNLNAVKVRSHRNPASR
jgi:hypothetical protein